MLQTTTDSLDAAAAAGALHEVPPQEPYAETWDISEIPTAQPEGLDAVMVQQDKLFVVLAVVLVIWFGVLIVLFRTDRRLKRLEARLDAADAPAA